MIVLDTDSGSSLPGEIQRLDMVEGLHRRRVNDAVAQFGRYGKAVNARGRHILTSHLHLSLSQLPITPALAWPATRALPKSTTRTVLADEEQT